MDEVRGGGKCSGCVIDMYETVKGSSSVKMVMPTMHCDLPKVTPKVNEMFQFINMPI